MIMIHGREVDTLNCAESGNPELAISMVAWCGNFWLRPPYGVVNLTNDDRHTRDTNIRTECRSQKFPQELVRLLARTCSVSTSQARNVITLCRCMVLLELCSCHLL